jgi:hypothetical protein
VIVRVVAGAVFVATAGWWTWRDAHGAFEPDDDGETTIVSLATVEASEPGRLTLEKAQRRYVVVGRFDVFPVGLDVTVQARRRPDGAWDADWVEPHPGRAAKRRLGAVGTAVTVALVAVTIRARRGGWRLRG